MARMTNPWRAMALVGVFVLAGCEPGVDVAAPLMDAPQTESAMTTEADLPPENAVTAVVESGLESLVVMAGPSENDGLLGAGCTVDDDEEALPDGEWFAFVLEATARELSVDIACVYGPGTDQFEAYATTDEARLSKYVVINDVIDERQLRFASDAQVYVAAENWEPREPGELVDNLVKSSEEGVRGVWLRVEDGRVSTVMQPYVRGAASS